MTVSIWIDFFFFATIIQIAFGIMFFFIGLARRLLLHSVSLILIIVPYVIHYHSSLHAEDFLFLSDIGFSLFPITLGLAVQPQFAPDRRGSIIPLFIVGVASFFMLAAAPHYRHLIIYVALLATQAVLSAVIWIQRRDLSSAAFTAVIAANIVLATLSLPARRIVPFIFSSGALSFFATLLLGLQLRRRIAAVQHRIMILTEQNEQLTRRIARMKQSNDHCRSIIIEKDRALLQLARHASLAELTAGIAHELAQPLTGIRGIAQNIIDDINEDEFDALQAVAELIRICSLVDKASSLIDHIRNFSKRRAFSFKALDLNRVVLEAIDLIRLQLKKNDIELIFVLDENIPNILGDRLSLEQLIVNIVLNAKDAILEHAAQGKRVDGAIRITTFSEKDEAVLVIQDNGTGMSEEIQKKIWSPFFTTKKGDRGTGIGLALCGRILKDHRARVDIRTGSEGTIFTIRFPGTIRTS